MRKIGKIHIAFFLVLLTLIVALGISTTLTILATVALGDFRAIAITVASAVAIYLYAFVIYRVFLYFEPLREGYIAEGSRAEFAANVQFLFYLILFNTLIRTHFLPAPILRLVYLALGAKMGRNSYSAGVILDPPLTEIGDNCIIGHDAVLFSHAIDGPHLSFASIHIGNDVTVGATAVVMPGVSIGDSAIVSVGAVVTKGTRIGPGEVWGGIPAKCIVESRGSA